MVLAWRISGSPGEYCDCIKQCVISTNQNIPDTVKKVRFPSMVSIFWYILLFQCDCRFYDPVPFFCLYLIIVSLNYLEFKNKIHRYPELFQRYILHPSPDKFQTINQLHQHHHMYGYWVWGVEQQRTNYVYHTTER